MPPVRSPGRAALGAALGAVALASAAALGACGPAGTATEETGTPPAPSESAVLPDAATGTALLFARAGGEFGDETIFVADLDGGTEVQLTDAGGGCCAAVSPDGTQILLLPATQSADVLASSTMPVSGGEPTPLPIPDPDLNLVAAAWSPDGSRIAFEGWVDGDEERTGVYVASYPDMSGLIQISSNEVGGHDSPTDFSPDGSQVVYFQATSAGGSWDIGGSLRIARTDGSGTSGLDTGDVAPSWWAKWSPDGSRIAFATGRTQGPGALWTVGPDGTGLAAVFEDTDGGYPITPAWSPDGSMLVFALDPVEDEWSHPDNDVYAIPATGGEPVLLFDGAGFQRHFDWFTPAD